MTDIDKNSSRLRRAAQTRRRIAQLRVARLAVHRTNGHIYAQIFSAEGDKVVASASTLGRICALASRMVVTNWLRRQ